VRAGTSAQVEKGARAQGARFPRDVTMAGHCCACTWQRARPASQGSYSGRPPRDLAHWSLRKLRGQLERRHVRGCPRPKHRLRRAGRSQAWGRRRCTQRVGQGQGRARFRQHTRRCTAQRPASNHAVAISMLKGAGRQPGFYSGYGSK